MKRVLLLFGAVLTAAALLAGCGGMKETDEVSQQTVVTDQETDQASQEPDVSYADDMVENMLAGLNQNDYAVFSRDFSDAMKAAINETAFESMLELFISTIGEYENKHFYQAADTTQNGVVLTVVVYTAQYTQESGDVIITVYFGGEEGSKKIEGLYFNSPKLRGE
jgi:outer membrane murein-binding lipoprotein Lpp